MSPTKTFCSAQVALPAFANSAIAVEQAVEQAEPSNCAVFEARLVIDTPEGWPQEVAIEVYGAPIALRHGALNEGEIVGADI